MDPRSSSPHFDSRVAPGRTKVPSLLFRLFLPSFRLHGGSFFPADSQDEKFRNPSTGAALSGGRRTLLIQHVLHLTLLRQRKDRNVKAADGGASKQAGSRQPHLFKPLALLALLQAAMTPTA